MNNTNTYIYKDLENNSWEFVLREDKSLVYFTRYSDYKLIKENKIDSDVLLFNIIIDKLNNLHLIYIKKGEIKYCIWNSKNWVKQRLYSFDGRKNEIIEASTIKMKNIMHLFFIIKDIRNSIKGTLMHCTYQGEKALINTIDQITFLPNVSNHYRVEIFKESKLYLFFLSKTRYEVKMKNYIYNKDSWIIKRKLYGLREEKINFYTLLFKEKIHILNISKQNGIWSIEDVYIDYNDKIVFLKIYEGKKHIKSAKLAINQGKLCAIWEEEDKILCSNFDNNWSRPYKFYNENNNKELLYKSNYPQEKRVEFENIEKKIEFPNVVVDIPGNQDAPFQFEEIKFQSAYIVESSEEKLMIEGEKGSFLYKFTLRIPFSISLKDKNRRVREIGSFLEKDIQIKTSIDYEYKDYIKLDFKANLELTDNVSVIKDLICFSANVYLKINIKNEKDNLLD
ncbi:hypothetical protein [Clostridium rectalis]|uniref:hypothetical protein n=1 Tax=Clostridium rectalis TaxID=2040295 RepID=UPI000F62F3BB|nr:hypothetical protein [Clostridium rectalis]